MWFAVAFGSLLGLGAAALAAIRPPRPAGPAPGGPARRVPDRAPAVDLLAGEGPRRTEPLPDRAVQARIRALLDAAGAGDLRAANGTLRVTVGGREYHSIGAIPDPAVRAQLHALLGDLAD
ncbi:MAG: hypothetical protein KatS3mg009_1721 [Acidimicrobiia bacterium]|nr:MAG: hypothetical protein KatS3mg009_1721 [Acidimicrobiia bacterium]